MTRKATCKLIEMAQDGILTWETIARECLSAMSEDEVANMHLYREIEIEEEEEEEEEDGE